LPKDLLLEIGTEEMPASAVEIGMSQLAEIGSSLFKKHHLDYERLETMGTPRRLVLLVYGLAEKQSPIFHEVKGPAKKDAFDENGKPTPAARGFARAQKVEVESLQVRETEQGEYVFAVKEESGKATAELLPKILKEAILGLSFPKSMRWGEGELSFSRPIRWILSLYGETIPEFTLDNLKSGNFTWGHRFLSPENPLQVRSSEQYFEVLKRGKVIVNPQERAKLIRHQIEEVAAAHQGRPVINQETFQEVVNLVEYPHAVYGKFPSQYLALPREVLIMALEAHQRYFPVEDERGNLQAGFIAVHNGDANFASLITSGHERVIQARLADAKFFYDEDQKEPLETRVEQLKGVIFQEKLGTLYQKVERIKELAALIATNLSLSQEEMAHLERAAHLCKADLLTSMVYEFPALQGVMGREYARLSGEPEPVAIAIYEHYLPRSSADSLPATRIGQILSIADKLDTIVGCFCLGFLPTGSEDPFSLRRQAQGIISIIIAYQLVLPFGQLIESSLKRLAQNGVKYEERVREELASFFSQRFRQYLLNQGLAYDTVDAVLAISGDDFAFLQKRAQVIDRYRGSGKMLDLITAFTRCKNLAQAEVGSQVKEELFEQDEEKKLYLALVETDKMLSETIARDEYEKAIEILASLRPVVDLFFDKVLVMAEEAVIRNNRLALLNKAVEIFGRIADFSKIVVGTDL